ncbi:hypothetical protein ACHQM5_028070 [Ranunculus cassubicifolius]
MEVEKQSNSNTGFIMRIGKKIVITGMVISSAPFFLPPLLVVSSVGFAFAVPFGLVFAGYACTEKVMSKLLSRPNVETMEENYGDEMEIMEDEFEEDVKKTMEMRIELPIEEGSEEPMEDHVVAVDDEPEEENLVTGENVGKFEEEGVESEGREEEIAAYSLKEPMIEEKPVENGGNYVQEEEPLVLESEYKENGVALQDETAEPIEDEAMIKEMVDSRKEDEIVEEEKPVVATVEMRKEGRRVEIEDNRSLKAKEVITIIENAREIADESGLDLFDVVTATLEQSRSESNEDSISPDMVSYYISQSVEVNSLPKRIRSVELSSVGKQGSLDPVVHPVSSETFESQPTNLVPETNPSKQALYSEEKMWELMTAMRKIVGYKAAKQSNFTEELKALYIFTGVEPPAAFKDPLDLGEVNDKIRLLMGIIGVK